MPLMQPEYWQDYETTELRIEALARDITTVMKLKGFWEADQQNFGEKIALMHSELSEALEADREGNKPHVLEELADTIIRILDYCGYYNLPIGQAITAKMAKNVLRPYKHNKEY